MWGTSILTVKETLIKAAIMNIDFEVLVVASSLAYNLGLLEVSTMCSRQGVCLKQPTQAGHGQLHLLWHAVQRYCNSVAML